MDAEVLHQSAILARRFVALSFCRADVLLELDNTRRILFCAGATPRLFGKTTEEMVGQPFLPLIHEGDGPLVQQLLSTAHMDGRIEDLQIRINVKAGNALDATLSGYRVPDFENNFFLALKVAPKKANKPKRREMDKDEQTGTLSEKDYADAAADRVRAYQAAGGEAKITMVKVDNLEKARQGLDADGQTQLMSAIGDILNETSLGGDTAGRIDDENFSFVHDAQVDVNEVNRKIEAAASQLGPDGVEISAGATTIDADADEMSEEQMAKAIVYTMQEFSQGKAVDGSNLSGNFQDMMAETMKSMEAFKKICATRAFDLVFMPICDLNSKQIHHFEALTRFRGPDGGIDSSPFKLITMAEEIGVISDFDLAVARKAVDFCEKQAIKGGFPPIAINVSGHSIGNKEFIGELHDLLKRATNLAKFLHLEITESAEITDLEGVNLNIQSFREKGFEVSLDDFGAGAASFDYLNSFEVDTVKFDGPVVKRAAQTDKGRAFLAAMATLCREIKVETIAEMVEDKEMATFLRDCGIHLGQGYFFGKPDEDPESFMKRKISF